MEVGSSAIGIGVSEEEVHGTIFHKMLTASAVDSVDLLLGGAGSGAFFAVGMGRNGNPAAPLTGYEPAGPRSCCFSQCQSLPRKVGRPTERADRTAPNAPWETRRGETGCRPIFTGTRRARLLERRRVYRV